MKLNCWLIFAALFSTGLLAQQATNTAPPAPIATPDASPAVTNTAVPATSLTNAPAKGTAKKKSSKKKTTTVASAKKKETELKSIPLVGGPAMVIASNVNVRGQAGLKGEVIGRLTKDQPVTVLEEIILSKSGPDEPSAWAKITLPSSIHVWVNSTFLDGTNKTVRPKKLNIRGGAGENYSVLGALKRGDAVKDLNTKGEWLEIEPPADAFAFVAAQYLKQDGTPSLAAVVPSSPTEPAPTPVTVPDNTPVVPPAAETPVVPPSSTETPTIAASAATNSPVPEVVAPPADEPPPRRIVQREGIVRGTVSIQAPTQFELVSPDNGRAINYLHTSSRDLDLRRYKGLRIVVTGEEGLDERWRNTPVITIQRIQVIE